MSARDATVIVDHIKIRPDPRTCLRIDNGLTIDEIRSRLLDLDFGQGAIVQKDDDGNFTITTTEVMRDDAIDADEGQAAVSAPVRV